MNGASITKWRERWRVTQAELADMLGVTRLTITRWENGAGFNERMLIYALRGLQRKLAQDAKLKQEEGEER